MENAVWDRPNNGPSAHARITRLPETRPQQLFPGGRMYQPDILAAAYAVAANHDAWRCTGEEHYLSEAIRGRKPACRSFTFGRCRPSR